MSELKILVTGASGKTGMPVVSQLREQGISVRAFVHQLDQRSELLSDLGAEVVVGDYFDIDSVRNAMQGISRVYFCYPPGEGLLQATAHVAIAAHDEGVDALVNMSQITAREGAGSPLAHQHWISEQLFDWAGIGASHIRPTFFAEDIFLFTNGSIGLEGKIYLPFGEGKHAPVSAEDIARVVVGILTDSKSHVSKRYVLTGPRDMTVTEMASIISGVLDKPVEYINIPIEVWREALIEKARFTEFLATHLAAVAKDHQDGIFSAKTDVVEKIGGQPPQSFEAFVRSNVEAL